MERRGWEYMERRAVIVVVDGKEVRTHAQIKAGKQAGPWYAGMKIPRL